MHGRESFPGRLCNLGGGWLVIGAFQAELVIAKRRIDERAMMRRAWIGVPIVAAILFYLGSKRVREFFFAHRWNSA